MLLSVSSRRGAGSDRIPGTLILESNRAPETAIEVLGVEWAIVELAPFGIAPDADAERRAVDSPIENVFLDRWGRGVQLEPGNMA